MNVKIAPTLKEERLLYYLLYHNHFLHLSICIQLEKTVKTYAIHDRIEKTGVFLCMIQNLYTIIF